MNEVEIKYILKPTEEEDIIRAIAITGEFADKEALVILIDPLLAYFHV